MEDQVYIQYDRHPKDFHDLDIKAADQKSHRCAMPQITDHTANS